MHLDSNRGINVSYQLLSTHFSDHLAVLASMVFGGQIDLKTKEENPICKRFDMNKFVQETDDYDWLSSTDLGSENSLGNMVAKLSELASNSVSTAEKINKMKPRCPWHPMS